MKLSVITDEFTQDIGVAIDLAQRYHLDGLELRSVEGQGLFELSEPVARRIAHRIFDAGLEVSALCPPLFKCNLFDDSQIQAHIAGLSHCLRLAEVFRTRVIRGFSFWRESDAHLIELIAERFYLPARMADDLGITIAIENDPSTNASNADELAGVLSAVQLPSIAALWDPGNDIFAPAHEEPYPHGYERIKSRIAHIHLKDAMIGEDGLAVACMLGNGEAGILELVRALYTDLYHGYITLETHYRSRNVLSEDELLLPGGAQFSEGGYGPTVECLDILTGLLGRK